MTRAVCPFRHPEGHSSSKMGPGWLGEGSQGTRGDKTAQEGATREPSEGPRGGKGVGQGSWPREGRDGIEPS